MHIALYYDFFSILAEKKLVLYVHVHGFVDRVLLELALYGINANFKFALRNRFVCTFLRIILST